MQKLLIALLLIPFVGCASYDVPEFVEIKHNETGYLVPLEGANKTGQAKFDSIKYLEQNRVAVKRIQIPHRWVKTGRMWFNGEWIDTVRLVVVNRSPVTREWTADEDSGTGKTNQAIWLESKDSIGFSLGFNATGYIAEEDTSKFLYRYPTTVTDQAAAAAGVDKSTAGLAKVMDTEIRARVQQLANIIAAKYDLDDLRARKAEILYAVRNGVPEIKDAKGRIVQEKMVGTIQFYKDRGITLSALGMFGGFEYEQPRIQEAIDATFIAQQEKVRTEAAFDAQAKKNARIELAAKAEANKEREIAKGRADAVKIEAEAEANAIRAVAQATKEAGKDPLFIQLKQLEVETARIHKWNGQYPSTLMNMGNGDKAPKMLLNIPAR